jgi:hypothetical protein
MTSSSPGEHKASISTVQIDALLSALSEEGLAFALLALCSPLLPGLHRAARQPR